jgi:Leucine Rich repeat
MTYPPTHINYLCRGLPLLAQLELSSNQIGDDGAQVIGAYLGVNPSVQRLYINGSHIGDRGAAALGRSSFSLLCVSVHL